MIEQIVTNGQMNERTKERTDKRTNRTKERTTNKRKDKNILGVPVKFCSGPINVLSLMLQSPILRYCGKGGLKVFEYVHCPIQNKPGEKK